MATQEGFSQTARHPENQYPIEIPTVSENLYKRTREALAKKGYTFVVNIESLSIDQLATNLATKKRFGNVIHSEHVRGFVPERMEVAINPKKLRIKDSNSKRTGVQRRMVIDEGMRLKLKLPKEVRSLISMRMQNASVLAQLDDKYQKETGKVLFTDWFGRTDDQLDSGDDIHVGRDGPANGLVVHYWFRDLGNDRVFAVPVAVLPRKLAV